MNVINWLRRTALYIIWCGPEHTARVISSMQRAGFATCNIPAIWKKGNSAGQAQGMNTNLGNSYEMFIYGRKGSAQIVKRGRSNVFDFAGVPTHNVSIQLNVHQALMREIIETFAFQAQMCWCHSLVVG